jgi:hypothetical protein
MPFTNKVFDAECFAFIQNIDCSYLWRGLLHFFLLGIAKLMLAVVAIICLPYVSGRSRYYQG